MKGRSKRRTILEICATDATFERAEVRGAPVWVGKCLHCNTRLVIAANGEPISRATIEHIVPRTHGGTDELSNLALACARCNAQKGYRHDVRHATDARATEVIGNLLERRRGRWREPA